MSTEAAPAATPAQRRQAVIADPVEALRRMIEIREIEDALNTLYSTGKIRGSIHTCQGQEAIPVAAAAVSQPQDYASATYRGHGVALAFGATPLSVVGEVLGRAVGSVGGVGGSMHLADAAVNVLPTMAIVGAGLPIAVGAALTATLKGTDAVSFAFFGDGATNIGAFHESLNLASLWRLPVVFICENNLYGEYSPLHRTTSVGDIAARGAANAVPAAIVDGQDFTAVKSLLHNASDQARHGGGPTLVEAKTYRYHGHSRSDPATYRTPEELAAWKERDPIDIHARRLVDEGTLAEAELGHITAAMRQAVAAIVEQALGSPEPASEALFNHVFAR